MRKILKAAKMAAEFLYYLPISILTIGIAWGILRLITSGISALAQVLNVPMWAVAVVSGLVFGAVTCYQDCTKKAE